MGGTEKRGGGEVLGSGRSATATVGMELEGVSHRWHGARSSGVGSAPALSNADLTGEGSAPAVDSMGLGCSVPAAGGMGLGRHGDRAAWGTELGGQGGVASALGSTEFWRGAAWGTELGVG